MSMVFTKLFSSITESTIWVESANVRLVWITMLAMADSKGRVWASVPGLANRARVPVEDVEEALGKFLGPDKYSRTPDNEGRRIEKIDGGWRLLNHAKYREIRDTEAVKESKRNYINNRRAKERASTVEQSRTQSNTVDSSRANAEADSEADAEAKQTPKSKPSATPPSEALESLPFCSLEFEKAWTDWIAHRKEIRKPLKPTQIRKQLEELAAIGESRAIATINHTITKGWQGLREPDITQELFHNPKADEFFEIFRAIYEEHTGSDYPEAKSDFAALNGLLNAFPALTASEWRNALRWCWTTADTDRFADKCVRQTGRLSDFCSAWSRIVAYHATYQTK